MIEVEYTTTKRKYTLALEEIEGQALTDYFEGEIIDRKITIK